MLSRLPPSSFIAIDPSTGRPVSLGSVAFYNAGTTTPKAVYLDRAGETIAPNPMPLNAAGMCDVWMDGLYRIEISDANGQPLYDRDYVDPAPGVGGGGSADGALLAVNNLADLADRAAARQVLGLARQDDPTDKTAGRVLAVGAFGLGGDAPRVSDTDALNDPGLPTGWVSIAAGDVTKVGGPSGASQVGGPTTAPAGVCETQRYGYNILIQAYYPLTADGNRTPWRRVYNGAWSQWVRDISAWSVASGWYTRQADGTQVCYFQKLQASFDTAANLLASWTFPIQFSGRPHYVSATLRPADDGGNATTIAADCAPGMSDLLSPVPGGINVGSCHFRVYRRTGAADFVSGNKVWLMCRAEGRWY